MCSAPGTARELDPTPKEWLSSRELLERMIVTVATSNAHMVALAASVRKLETLPVEVVQLKEAFGSFRKLRDDNGQPGMCTKHETAIGDLKVASARAAGRWEVWAAIAVGILLLAAQMYLGSRKPRIEAMRPAVNVREVPTRAEANSQAANISEIERHVDALRNDVGLPESYVRSPLTKTRKRQH